MLEEDDNEIEEKQKYLRNEIMNQNYDTNKFSDYISNLKENGVDLNNWTLEELKKVVSEFKNQENNGEMNDEENIERELENVRNSFILSQSESEKKLPLLNYNNENKILNNIPTYNNNQDNPYSKIFDDKVEIFKNVENIMSNLDRKDGEKKTNLLDDFEILESSQFIDTSTDKLLCIKQPENSLSKYNDLNVNIIG